MRNSAGRILTTHSGSLSRPADLVAMSKSIAIGEAKGNDAAYARVLAAAVRDVVNKQRELGVDIPDDGEFGKPVAGNYDYGAWWNYAFARMSGFSPAGSAAAAAHETQHKKSSVADLALTSFANRRDWQRFGAFYRDPELSGSLMGSAARRPVGRPACTGPLKYWRCRTRSRHRQSEKGARGRRRERRFYVFDRTGSFARGVDLYYKTEEEFLFASADAMRDEYKAIVDAGFVLQIDDPQLPDNWDMINPAPSVADFSKFSARVEAFNHALRGLPADRIRYHMCWGSWHRPHITDIPFADIVDLVLAVNAGAIRSRRVTSAMSTSGECGRTSSRPTASC